MADPLLASLCVDLIVAALVEAARSTSGLVRVLDDRTALRNDAVRDETVAEAIELAVERLTAVEAIAPAVGGESLRAFLVSPECRQALVPVFYPTQLADRPLSILRENFAAVLASWTGITRKDAKVHGPRVFDALVAGMQRAFRVAAGRNVLAAHEAMSHLRHALLEERLAGIERNIALLRAPAAPSPHAIRAYFQTYRRQVAHREGFVVPPHLDRQRKHPLNDVYVAPALQRERSGSREPGAEVAYRRFPQHIQRTVVLGDPGGGKTTLTKKIACDLSSAEMADAEPTGLPLVAIPVILRDYAVAQQHGASLLKHIEQTAMSRYQMPDPPEGTFEYLLHSGLAIVLLDGLDELLDTSRRREVTAGVEAFAHLFPSTPMLVTSRRIGYDQAPLDPQVFTTYGLAPFDDGQVADYAVKAFSLEAEEPVAHDSPIVSSFLAESAAVKDLRSNPLLLGLMCNLYRGENYIPANRPDVYEKCALMLFERWDRMRGINPILPFQSRLRPALQFLAHWIYGNDDLHGGITYGKLVDRATSYLLGRRFDDPDEAHEAALAFIDLCKGRAWVFTDMGSDADGSPLFQFTHRTFLEYFAAAYVVCTNPTPEQLADAILPRMARREWDAVLQLAVQLQGRRVEDSTDVLLDCLITTQLAPDARANVNAFVREALQYLTPSPAMVRRIATDAIEEAVRAAVTAPRDESATGIVHGIVAHALVPLFDAGVETRATVERTAIEQLAAHVHAHPDALALLDLVLHLPADRAIQERVSSEVRAATLPVLLAAATTDWRIAGDLVRTDDLAVEEFVDRFELAALFRSRAFRHNDMVSRSPLAPQLYYAYARVAPDARDDAWSDALFPRLAPLFRKTPPPWMSIAEAEWDPYWFWSGKERRPARPAEAWCEDGRFAAFVMLALAAEAGGTTKGRSSFYRDPKQVRTVLDHLEVVTWATYYGKRGPEAVVDALFAPQDAWMVQVWRDGLLEFSAP